MRNVDDDLARQSESTHSIDIDDASDLMIMLLCVSIIEHCRSSQEIVISRLHHRSNLLHSSNYQKIFFDNLYVGYMHQLAIYNTSLEDEFVQQIRFFLYYRLDQSDTTKYISLRIPLIKCQCVTNEKHYRMDHQETLSNKYLLIFFLLLHILFNFTACQ